MTAKQTPQRKSAKNRRPPRTAGKAQNRRRRSPKTRTKRLAQRLPKQVEKMPVVKDTVKYLDGQERNAEKTMKRWTRETNQRWKRLERTARKTRVFKSIDAAPDRATKLFDQLLDEIGLVRKSVHQEALKKARAKKKATRKKKKTSSKRRTTKKKTTPSKSATQS